MFLKGFMREPLSSLRGPAGLAAAQSGRQQTLPALPARDAGMGAVWERPALSGVRHPWSNTTPTRHYRLSLPLAGPQIGAGRLMQIQKVSLFAEMPPSTR